ncbi:MAG: glutathione S-transferase family protein [Rhodoblastus sp.]|nr:glutathione S-transferase family protein [Rhodoblastus sp.]
MRLFFHPLSSNARRALLVARHLGLDIELVSVALESGAQKSPAYLALNPNGRVPLLVDGDFVLWESHAIMQYLADTTGGQDIYPAGAKARADVNRWLFWSACHFAPACALFIRERVSKAVLGAGGPDPAEIDRGEAQLPPVARMLDDHLSARDWIAQDRLTLADFAVAAPLMHAERAQLPLQDYANFQRWFARVRQTAAWRVTEPA